TVDLDNWMRTFAGNDLAANWDSFGNAGGRNTYHYTLPGAPWTLFSWDFDVGLGVENAPPDAPLFDVADPVVARLSAAPGFVRRYWAGLDEAVDLFFENAIVDPWLDTRYAVLAAEGLAAPDAIKAFVTQRRAFLLAQLAMVRAGWAVAQPPDVFVVSSNLF